MFVSHRYKCTTLNPCAMQILWQILRWQQPWGNSRLEQHACCAQPKPESTTSIPKKQPNKTCCLFWSHSQSLDQVFVSFEHFKP